MRNWAPPALTLRQLQYALAVAETKNFRKAAQVCAVAQPSLSAQIMELEDALGVRLFERLPRGVVVTEAATNLARHARDGVILLRDTTSTGRPGVELLAVDAGPGMEDLSHLFTDGVSTGGTPGTGLGAMRRMAHELDLYSRPGQGTVLVARLFAGTAAAWDRGRRAPLVDVGLVCTPVSPETVSGDGWCVIQGADRAAVLVVDGLGHGPSAAEAADVARRAVH